jgi:superoxide reductase
MSINDSLKTADFKTEKHAPVIEIPEKISNDTSFTVTVSVGKEITHPNTTEHFIDWISLYFKPSDSQNVINLGRVDFSAHGESASGANKGPAYTEPAASFVIKLKEEGKLIAISYCNIHGLWENEIEVTFNT